MLAEPTIGRLGAGAEPSVRRRRRRVAVLGSLLLAGAGGVVDLGDLSSSQVPFEPSVTVVRAIVAVTLGLGAALAVIAASHVLQPGRVTQRHGLPRLDPT